MTWVPAVRVKTTVPVYLKPGTCPKVVDGVQLHKGDRILVTEQPEASKNGLYEVWRTDQGSPSGMTSGHS